MPTIAQAQARLGNKVFAGLGEDPTATPALSTVEAMMALYAEEFITAAKNNLEKDNSISEGTLRDSMRFETKSFGRNFNLSIFVADYYDYINRGVKGVKGSQNTPYKFKYVNPSKTHVEAIRKWIKEGRSKIRVSDVKYGKTKTESKAISKTDKERSLAYIIARSIKKKGINGTGFWSEAFENTFKDFGVQISKALGQDVRIDLRNVTKVLKTKR